MIVLLAGRDAISMSFRHDAIAPAIRDRNPQVSSGDESLCGLEYRRATIAAALCRGNYQRGLASSWAAYFLLPDFLTALAVFATLWLRLAVVFLLLLRAVFFARSEEHTSELQSLMRISYAVFCLKKKHTNKK